MPEQAKLMTIAYLTVVAMLLLVLVALRNEKVRDDGWEPVPWYVCLAVFAFVAAWPLWVVLAVVLEPFRPKHPKT